MAERQREISPIIVQPTCKMEVNEPSKHGEFYGTLNSTASNINQNGAILRPITKNIFNVKDTSHRQTHTAASPSLEWPNSADVEESTKPSAPPLPCEPSNLCLPYLSNYTEAPLRPITKNYFNANSNRQNQTASSGVEWANAPEFVPQSSKPKSYAEVVHPKSDNARAEASTVPLCPSIKRSGICRLIPNCQYIHGDICEFCGCAVLHPTDVQQKQAHQQKCRAHYERQMELSLAVARSKDKTCGICFEVVMDKIGHERRFGILAQCNHCFCLSCIRKWRKAREFEHKVVKACPECRITSDFVCPSAYWVDTQEDKEKLIGNYKTVLADKPCKYFRQGNGKCPFGNKCFYLHALPNGVKADVGPPPRRRRRNRHREERELSDTLHQLILFDLMDEPDNHFFYSISDDIEDFVAFFSDSDESEWSDYEFLID